jgi:predicted acetyltransferase
MRRSRKSPGRLADVTIEIRSPSDDELEAAMRAGTASFGEQLNEGDVERHRKTMPPDRFIAAYDNGRPVGTAAACPFELTIPGGRLRAGGVTWVGVLPSHRRRGILTQFMRYQFDDLHERGDPLAILWASESAIYGRFGYGISAPNASIDAERVRFRFRDDPGPTGAVRFVDADEAAEVLPPVYDRLRVEIPGMFSRPPEWWKHLRLADPEAWRRGAGPKFFAVYERDGQAEGYAIYRVKDDWHQGIPQGQVRVHEAFGTSSGATREVWRFLFGIDLIARVQAQVFDLASPLPLMVADMRSLHLTVGDGLWLRFVDVEAALRARAYAAAEPVVLEVRDELCPWNAGRFRVGAGVERTEDAPDLELDVADLASAFLGAFDFHALARAERVTERTDGALAHATKLFRTERPPFCPEVF